MPKASPMKITPLHTISLADPRYKARVWRAAISADGLQVATSSYFRLDVRAVGEDAPRWTIEYPLVGNAPTALLWSDDARLLLVATRAGLETYDGATGALLATQPVIHRVEQMIWAAGPTPRIWTAHFHAELRDVATGELLASLAGPASFQHIALTADQTRLLAVGDKSLWVFDVATQALLHRYPFARFGASTLASALDGSSAWVTQAGDTIHRLHVGNKGKKVLATHSPATHTLVHRAASLPTRDAFLLVSGAGVSLHSFADGAALDVVAPFPDIYCDGISVSADGARAVTGHLDATARVWEIA
jgi:hypothetical protein